MNDYFNLNEIENKNRDELITGRKNYMVEAGAGAGKTFLLVNRLINLILNENILPEEIVAITFTVKAATDLRRKIYEEFIKRAKVDERAKSLLDMIPRLNIGTIHSFSNSIIKRRPFDAGLSLSYRVLEDLEFRNYLFSVYDDFEKVLDKYVDVNTKKLFLQMKNRVRIIENYSKMSMNEEVDFPVIDGFETFDKEKYLEEIENILVRLKSLSNLNRDAMRKEAAELFQTLDNSISLKEDSILENILKSLSLLYRKNPESPIFKIKIPKSVSAEDREKIKALKEEELEIISDADKLFTLFQKIVYRAHIRVTRGFIKYLDKMNIKNSVISNDEVLRYALKILSKDENRNYFKKIYKYIFVDESQDTDLVQTRIILSLVTTGSTDINKDIGDFKLLPNSIFMVGDRKQSIYRFRGADVNTYEILKNLFQSDENSKYVSLQKSFRFEKNFSNDLELAFNKKFLKDDFVYDLGVSKIISDRDEKKDSGIYKTVLSNEYFSSILTNIDEGHELLEEIKTEEEKETFSLNYMISKEEVLSELKSSNGNINKKFKCLKKTDKTLFLKAKLLILDLIKNGTEKKDILVLTMGNEGVKIMTNLLREEGISCDSSAKEDYFLYDSVKRAYILIRFFENQSASNFFEVLIKVFSKDPVLLKSEMVKIKSLGFANYFKGHCEILEDEEYEFLEKYLKLSKENPSSFVMSLFYEDIFFKGEYSYSEYEVFYSFFREILNSGESLLNIKNKMEVIRKPGFRDSVKVMNIHKAKGLESSTVVLISEKIESKRSGDYFDRKNNKGYLEFATGYSKNILLNHGNKEAVLNSVFENYKEFVRISYVAFSRAKDYLYLVSNGGFYEDILDGFKLKLIEPSSYVKENENSFKSYRQSLMFSLYNNSEESILEAPFGVEDGIYHGKYYGTIFHMVMESVLLDIVSNRVFDIEKTLKNKILEFVNEDELQNEDLYFVFEIDRKENLELEIYKKIYSQIKNNVKYNLKILEPRIKSAKYVYPEMPFTYKNKDHLISGRMDLVLIFSDHIEIYDYKTDINIESTMFKYQKQLSIYKDACEVLFNIGRDKIFTKILRGTNET